MRLICITFSLLMALITSSQCIQTAEDFFYEGNALADQGKYNDAIKAYDEAIRLDHKYVAALNNKGNALKALGKTIEADAALAKARELSESSDMWGDWFDKGNALYAQGKYDEATKAYDEAIRLDPKYPAARYNKGNALYAQGKYDEATKAYNEAIRLDPKYAVARYNKGTFNKAPANAIDNGTTNKTLANATKHIPSYASPAGKHSCLIGTHGIAEFLINWADKKDYVKFDKSLDDGTISFAGSSESWQMTTFYLTAYTNKDNNTLGYEIWWHPSKKNPSNDPVFEPEGPASKSIMTIQGKKALLIKFEEKKLYQGSDKPPDIYPASLFACYYPDDYTYVKIYAPASEWKDSEFRDAVSSLKITPPVGYY